MDVGTGTGHGCHLTLSRAGGDRMVDTGRGDAGGRCWWRLSLKPPAHSCSLRCLACWQASPGVRTQGLMLAAGMLAGVLLRRSGRVRGHEFPTGTGTGNVRHLAGGTPLVPRYAVIATLLVGIAVAASRDLLHAQQVQCAGGAAMGDPSPVLDCGSRHRPALFVVTMQNIPGVAVMRASGYDAPVSLIGWIGVNTLLAPFGAYALNLAAITAAICMGRDAHEDPARRHRRHGRWAYIVIGLFVPPWPLFAASKGAGGLRGRYRVVRHHRQQPGQCAGSRAGPRGGTGHLPGHRLRRLTGRHRFGVLGPGGRCAVPAGAAAASGR